MRIIPRRFSALAILSCSVVFLASAGVAAAQDMNTYLYIADAASGRNVSAQNNPAYPIDVSANGVCVAHGVAFGKIVGPFTGPATSYTFDVSVANTEMPCSNSPVFSISGVSLAAGMTYFGVVKLDASNNITGQIIPADFSSIPAGQSRIMVVNATPRNLTASLQGNSSSSLNIMAGAMAEGTIPSGVYAGTVDLMGTSTWEAGPSMVEAMSRDLYFYVLAGSEANQSVQIIGPEVVRDVF